ncbi:MAG: flagellar hook-associated protein FlgK [Verrucomicrobiota bacterium]
MPASIHNLYTQSRSLQAYTQALQVTGQNIASSAQKGYAKQQVVLQSNLPGSVPHMGGSAVNASIKDTRDALISSQIRREQGDLGYQEEHLGYAEQLELTLFSGSEGPLDLAAEGGAYLNRGLLSSLSTFLDSWADLEAKPDDTAARQSVLDSAGAMVDRFHSDAENLGELRGTVETAVEGSVARVNELLGQVASVQQQLSRLPGGQTTAKAELTTLREESLSELSEYIGFSFTDNAAAPLESSLTVRLADGTTAELLTGSQVNDTLNWDGADLSLTTAGTNLATDKGRLGAQANFLNDTLNEYENHWDLLAGEMVRVVNGLYNPGATPGEDFFVAGSGTAASIEVEVANATLLRAGTGGTGNDIARSLAALAKADLAADHGSPITAGSFSDDLLERQNTLARRIASEQDAVSAQEKVVSFLEQEQQSRSGVDLDAEIAQLLQFQRSYQASSRVLRTLDEVLQTFLSDLR